MSKIEVKIPKTINKTCIGFPPVGIAFLGSVHGNGNVHDRSVYGLYFST